MMDKRKFSGAVLQGVMTCIICFQALEKVQNDPALAVEGCQYELIPEDRYDEALNLYADHFVPDEPVGAAISLEWCDEYEDLVLSELEHNMSIGLIASNTGQLVGFRMISIMNKNDDIDTRYIKNEKFKLIEDFLKYLAELANVFEHYGVEDVFHFFAIGVHRDWRQKGIGSKLMKAGMSLVANLDVGPVVVSGEGSSNYSKKIYENLNFDILTEVQYAEYKVDGVAVFQNTGEHRSERVYGKIIY